MKTAFRIFARDLKALVTNPIALIVVCALLVLPGLYAWYCIIANWDPYANTGNVPIAIVNKDAGATSDLAGDVNIGSEVAGKLRDNDSIDWRFYDDEREALDDTATGACYATLVIPEDLSKNIVGIFEGSDEPPVIYYYPNEKFNAVAVKVSDSAAQTLIRQINQGFSSTVNEKLIQAVQQGVDTVGEKADETRTSTAEDVRETQRHLAKILASLDDATSSIEGWRTSVAGAQEALGVTADQLPSLQEDLAGSSVDLEELRKKTVEFDSSFSKALAQASLTLASVSAETSSGIGTASTDVSKVSGVLNEAIQRIRVILDDGDETGLIAEKLLDVLAKLEDVSSRIDKAVEGANATVQSMNDGVQDAVEKTNAASDGFSKTVLPQLSEGTYALGNSLAGLSGALGQLEPQIRELQNVLDKADSALADALGAIAQSKSLISRVSQNLGSTATDMGALGSALQIEQISRLLGIDPDNVKEFVSSPVHMVTEEVYPVSNYGTAVAPFYTNLALWIGCFILASLIKVEVKRTRFEAATNAQRYFGRWLLFILLALIQSQVICGVDILLGIDCANPVAFMAVGAVCSFAYMNLIFALVIAFRNVGKTLCIVLLIMQVPGSSGMYPIQMMPEFFQFIHPSLPFTYGIDAMREALCGMYGAHYLSDVGFLVLIVPVALFIGLVLRPLMMNLLQIFDEEMRKTGFFASEEHGQGRDSRRVRNLMRFIMSNDEYRDDLEERAWSFKSRYPKLSRMGSTALFAVPFVFLALMLALNFAIGLDIDAKLTALVLMIVVLLVIAFGLVVLEYINRTIAEETRLLGESIIVEELGEGFSDEIAVTEFEEEPEEVDDGDAASCAEFESQEVLVADEVDVLGLREELEQTDEEPVCNMGPELQEANVADDTAVPELHDELEEADEEPVRSIRPAQKKTRGTKRHGVAFDIFSTDMRLGFQSVIGVVIMVLLVITPSLYAWFNIAGSWNPYGSTGNLKVAVANDDDGYKGDIVPLTLNVGDTIVSQLRGNTNFNWIFVDSGQAVSGVESGDYYAAIVIPHEFSKNMMTYLVNDADYPNVVYYTNEKENPIAPIITQKGADSIQESIRETFTQRVDEVGLTIASDLAGYITKPNVTDYFNTMGNHVDDAVRDMSNGAAVLSTLSSLSGTVSNVVGSAGVALDGMQAGGDTAKNALTQAESGAQNASSAIESASSIVKTSLSGAQGKLDDVVASVDTALDDLRQSGDNVPAALHEASAVIELVAEATAALAEDMRARAETLAEEEPEAVVDEGIEDEDVNGQGEADPSGSMSGGAAAGEPGGSGPSNDAGATDESSGDTSSEETAEGAGDVNGESPQESDDGSSAVREAEREAELEAAARIDAIAKSLKELASSVANAANHADSIDSTVQDTRDKLKKLAAEARSALDDARSFYEDGISSSADGIKATMTSAKDSVHSMLNGLEDVVGGLSSSTSGLTNQLDALEGDLSDASTQLDTTSSKLKDAKQRFTDALASGDVAQMTSVIVGADTTAMANRLAVPVEQVREPLYPVSNYGSAMAPFYTVLSLWVGALVMISTMRVHVVEERMEELRKRYRRVRPRHEYFGRYGIFGFISLLQSLLVLLGDLVFLHIQCENPILFVLLGVFVGQVFCLFVYTMTELFGDVGKALCVILLIMQVAASGGTFPVEMLGGILSEIAEFLPFYHGMGLLQECVAGVFLPQVVLYCGYLAIVVFALMLVGVVVRKPFRILNDWLEGQLEKTGYM